MNFWSNQRVLVTGREGPAEFFYDNLIMGVQLLDVVSAFRRTYPQVSRNAFVSG